MWHGDYLFLLRNLILKDFRTRYRNMSLGVFWSLVNPLVMMAVLTFVFTKIFANPMHKFPVFVLCGIVPFTFLSQAWASGTTSIIENAQLIKRVPVPREALPIANVLGSAIHLFIQVGLLLAIALAFRTGINWYWLWLPALWMCELVFVCGCALVCGALNVYVRDMRYVVESACTVLFWVVPIFYDISVVPAKYAEIYQYNPIAALVLALRTILLEAKAPRGPLLIKLFFVSFSMFVLGWAVFRRLRRRFYDYL